MKVFSKLMFVFLILGLASACTNTPEGEAAKVGEATQEAPAVSAKSTIFSVTEGVVHWTATKVGGEHSGTINVGRGQISVEGENVSGGKFSIDMKSIKVTDGTPEEMATKLMGHLASEDFFGTETFPYGTFMVASIEANTTDEEVSHNITGNLSLKGIAKSITIPANVTFEGDNMKVVTPKFTINRVDWDIKYGSGVIGTVADKIIHDDISLYIELSAKK